MIGCFPSIILAALIALAVTLVPGCASSPNQGYAFDSTFDESINTIAIPIFRNETTSRGIEVQLTEAIMKQVSQRTPWRLTPSDRADTTLVGVVTGTTLRALSDDPQTGLVQEQAVQITIRFEWRDNRSGEILVAPFASGDVDGNRPGPSRPRETQTRHVRVARRRGASADEHVRGRVSNVRGVAKSAILSPTKVERVPRLRADSENPRLEVAPSTRATT